MTEGRQFRRMVGVVLLAHLGLAAIPIVWVKIRPAPPMKAPSAMARIEWLEPEITAPEPEPVPLIAKQSVPKPALPPPLKRKLAARPSKPVKRSPSLVARVARFQSAASKSQAGAHEAASEDALAAYHARIQKTMEERWRQPKHLAGDAAPTARVAITISRSGAITEVALAASSGQPELDQSALEAARAVPQIDPLPSVIEDDTYRLLIRFVLH